MNEISMETIYRLAFVKVVELWENETGEIAKELYFEQANAIQKLLEEERKEVIKCQ